MARLSDIVKSNAEGVQAVYIQSTAPNDTTKLWYDTSTNTLKSYNTNSSQWEIFYIDDTNPSNTATFSGDKINTDLSIKADVTYVDAQDQQTLADAKTYTDNGLALKEDIANKNQPNGYAGLDASGRILDVLLPFLFEKKLFGGL